MNFLVIVALICCHIEIWHLVQHKFTGEEMLVVLVVTINSGLVQILRNE